jgi:hypothetical protein
MKQFIFCLTTIVGLHFSAAAQNFKVAVAKASGDLNKDGIEDLVTVMQDTLHENAPYRLQVSFGKGDEKFTPIVFSDKLIEPQYPDGRDGFRSGNGFDSVEIKKGILLVNISLLRGYITYKFRYQNGNFELIGYKSSSSDGIGTIYSDDFNLSTGDRITIRENYETGKIISNEKTKKLVRPLPKLQDIKAFEEQW